MNDGRTTGSPSTSFLPSSSPFSVRSRLCAQIVRILFALFFTRPPFCRRLPGSYRSFKVKKKVTQEGQGEEGLGFLRSVGLLFPSKVKGKSKRKCKGKALLLRAQSRPRDWLAVFPFSLFFSCWFSPGHLQGTAFASRDGKAQGEVPLAPRLRADQPWSSWWWASELCSGQGFFPLLFAPHMCAPCWAKGKQKKPLLLEKSTNAARLEARGKSPSFPLSGLPLLFAPPQKGRGVGRETNNGRLLKNQGVFLVVPADDEDKVEGRLSCSCCGSRSTIPAVVSPVRPPHPQPAQPPPQHYVISTCVFHSRPGTTCPDFPFRDGSTDSGLGSRSRALVLGPSRTGVPLAPQSPASSLASPRIIIFKKSE